VQNERGHTEAADRRNQPAALGFVGQRATRRAAKIPDAGLSQAFQVQTRRRFTVQRAGRPRRRHVRPEYQKADRAPSGFADGTVIGIREASRRRGANDRHGRRT